jgi:hypothetical protein
VVGGVGLRDGRELVRLGLPVVLAGVDDGSAERRAVAADPLGEGLDHDGRAVLCGTVEVGRREGVVDEDGHRRRQGVCGLDQRRDVRDVDEGVADGLDVPELGVLLRGGDERVDVVVLDEGGLDAEVAEGV